MYHLKHLFWYTGESWAWHFPDFCEPLWQIRPEEVNVGTPIFSSSLQILKVQTSNRIWSRGSLGSPLRTCEIYCYLQVDSAKMSWIRGHSVGALCQRMACWMLGRNSHVLWNHRSDLHGGGAILGEADWACFLCSGPLVLRCLLGCFFGSVKGETLWQSCRVWTGYKGCYSRCFKDSVFLCLSSHIIPTVG